MRANRRLVGAALAVWLMASAASAAEGVDFSRDVRPILSGYCFKCHGPDETRRESGLRLDVREAATAKLESGQVAIVPGAPDRSELLRRVFSDDENALMPPPATKTMLTPAQKETLKKWIAAGAEYKPHWSFVAPQRPPVPAVQHSAWPRGPADALVLAKQEAANVRPAPEADRYSLLRRASLDLTGLPPTLEETEAFVRDTAPDAFERQIDRLLAAPDYGQRWARRWLDLARYADTNGYEKDRPRTIWPYRDWVIQALNADLPFDQFSIEQIAGDMLPNATLAQKIATGFHRNTMINEEGGIDPLEFRYHAMTDRVNTTGTVWLGLTIGCAQCHTHKYDPIPQREYYQMFGLLNNADEPELEVRPMDFETRRADVAAKIAAIEADLPNRFPVPADVKWQPASVVDLQATNGAALQRLDDGSILATGENPAKTRYTVVVEAPPGEISAVKLEALTHESLGKTGPGRTPHGNFVLTEISAALAGNAENTPALKFVSATADVSQEKFPVADAIDGKPGTGWAVHAMNQPLNQNRSATFTLAKPVGENESRRWAITLDQNFGTHHTLGRFRISFGVVANVRGPVADLRRQHLQEKFAAWLDREAAGAARWESLRPIKATSNLPLLTIEGDDTVFASGDMSKSDLYDVTLQTSLAGITAIRLEALPDERLPKRGPGRVYYEGPHGDFFLSHISLAAGNLNAGEPLTERPFAKGASSFANGKSSADAALDDNKQTGWSINGGQGKPHVAVFSLKEPLGAVNTLQLKMLFERYYAAGLGRFRVSATTHPNPAATVLPRDVEEALTTPAAQRTPQQTERLLRHFLSVTPELATAREEIERLRKSLDASTTTLVMLERPANNPRPTFRHHRGEFLQPKERVEPGVFSFLPPLPPGAAKNRLAFAQWLVDPANPLVGRVTVNRHWAAFFGRGLVRTTEDFGLQGELPSNQLLLDWLASEFVDSGSSGSGVMTAANHPIPNPKSPTAFSTKRLHRTIVTSATYRQSSRATPELLTRDPYNELLARGPRVRLEAELVRDAVLQAAGLLTKQIGGPSVFPPQPASVTTEGTYGAFAWNTSTGANRYRRSLYTFAKRTAPFAMFITFDGTSGESCVARREVSNTPLQALTLLNDTVFTEASQALGREFGPRSGTVAERIDQLFQRCLTRPATNDERSLLEKFYEQQRQRLVDKSLDAAAIAGANSPAAIDVATWTILARAVLNLDEMISKN